MDDIKTVIKHWDMLDEKCKILNTQQRELRNEKQVFNNKICQFLKEQKGSQITIGETQIKMSSRKDYSPLTFTYIEDCLKTIITSDTDLKYIMNTLKNKRQIKITNELKKV
jgi:hypothetical protein|tara:strand:+ start:1108 stop:1440 length:333 start_codon:yes stop_codon:yes gene_type:complete